tara:strand:+ start:2552 stop:2728 length:177 start_codon:yes stop_codon:yes gene_type:complete
MIKSTKVICDMAQQQRHLESPSDFVAHGCTHNFARFSYRSEGSSQLINLIVSSSAYSK